MPQATEAESLWSRARSRLEAKLGSRYEACFGEVVAQRLKSDVLTLGAPNAFVRDYIIERFAEALELAVAEAAARKMRVEVELIRSTSRAGDVDVPPHARQSAPDLNLDPPIRTGEGRWGSGRWC